MNATDHTKKSTNSSGPAQPTADRLAFDRADRIGLTILLWLVGAVAVGGLLGLPILRWIRGEAILLPLASNVSVPDLDRTGVAYSSAQYSVELATASVGQRLLDLLPGLVTATVVVTVIALFLKVMRSISAGTPFAGAQVRRLRQIAVLLVIGIPVAAAARLAADSALTGGMDLGGLSPSATLEIPWLPIVLGLVAALLGEAFKVGARLADDVEGLI